MTRGDRLLRTSGRWFKLLLRLYPPDFRDEMGDALVEAYCDRAREALRRGGIASLVIVWLTALADSLRNGPSERAKPAVAWRRNGNWGRDAELVMRRLARAPGFAAATVGTLTIGLAMFAVVYATVQKIVIEPMPYRDPDDLYFVWRDYGTAVDLKRGSLAGLDIVELRKAGGVIEDAVGLSRFWGGIFQPREGVDPMEIVVTVSTPNLFEVLGARPALGRGFAPNEIGAGRPGVIVLAHELWSRIGGDPAIVGTDVRLNGQPYTVIGVMPPDFTFVRHESTGPPQHIDAYITFAVDLEHSRPGAYFSGLIRARRGSSPSEVTAAVDAVGRAVDARDFNSRGLKLYPVALKADLIAGVRPALLVLAAAGVVLALMLMVNLALVLLARTAQREQEFAVSRALGASRGAVVRATLLEGGVLGALGGALGSVAAIWGTRAVVALAPLDLPRREAVAMDWAVGSVVVGVGGLLGLLAAIVPATWATRASLSSLLARAAVRGGGGHGRLGRGMIVAQVALSLILLSTGGLVVRSLERLLRADPGFRPDGVLTMLIRTPPEFFPGPGDVIGFQDRVVGALAAIPGVIGASATSGLPLSAYTSQSTITIPGAPGNTGDPAQDGPVVDVVGMRAGYVGLMGMRLLAGRDLAEARREGVREALIDQHLARRFFPDGNPLGATIPYGHDSLTIVGVVRQARLYGLQQDGRPQILVRAEDWGYRPLFYVVRTTRDPRALIPEARAAIRRFERRVAVGNLRTMDEILGDALRPQQTSAVLIAGLALGALLLAAMGLFGVISGSVTRRRHELAVRMALGADYGRALRLVLREGALLVGIGMLIGLPGIYAAGRLVRALLVEVSPSDPLTLAVVALGLALVSMTACYVPARQVLRIEPATSLREG